jgi:hypothetical protein
VTVETFFLTALAALALFVLRPSDDESEEDPT